jgi:hypothetical protein
MHVRETTAMAAEEEATVEHVMSGHELPEREAAAEPQRALSCDRTLLRKDAASWSGRDTSSLYRSSTRQYASCTHRRQHRVRVTSHVITTHKSEGKNWTE